MIIFFIISMDCYLFWTSNWPQYQTNFLKTCYFYIFLGMRLLWKLLILVLSRYINIVFSFIKFIAIEFIHPFRIFLQDFLTLKYVLSRNLFINILHLRYQLLNTHFLDICCILSKTTVENRGPLLAKLFIVYTNLIMNQRLVFFDYIIVQLHHNLSHFI